MHARGPPGYCYRKFLEMAGGGERETETFFFFFCLLAREPFGDFFDHNVSCEEVTHFAYNQYIHWKDGI